MSYCDYEIVKPIKSSKPVNFSSGIDNTHSLIAKKFKSEDALELLLTSKRIYEMPSFSNTDHGKAELAKINSQIESIKQKLNK
jgi:hypothetical protein